MLLFILQINWELDPLGSLELRESDAAVGLGPRGLPRSAGCQGLPRLPEQPTWVGGCHCGLIVPSVPTQVSERPLMFLLDTPGVLAPRIESVETGLKLALCGEPGLGWGWGPCHPTFRTDCGTGP